MWHNRSFSLLSDSTVSPPLSYFVPDLATPGTLPNYWDLGVLGAAATAQLNPQYSLLTSTAGYAGTNRTGDPVFLTRP